VVSIAQLPAKGIDAETKSNLQDFPQNLAVSGTSGQGVGMAFLLYEAPHQTQ
jgi:hypothetical protein